MSDNGQGIPADALPKLFTKFFRVSGYLEAGSKGNGLGLYICKAIIDLHSGKIWAESELGKGSTFSFSLPAVKEGSMASVEENGSKDEAMGLTIQSTSAIVLNKTRWSKG